MTGIVRSVFWIALGAAAGLILFSVGRTAHALPEYTTRTGEPCATCHVNPAGGGPRTMRGTLWIAAGRPDQVPDLPGATERSDTASEPMDDRALYEQFACSRCHGVDGEGGAATALNRTELPAEEIARVIREGKGSMLGYDAGRMSEAELAAITRFTQAVGRGETMIKFETSLPVMQPAKAICGAPTAAGATLPACGGN